MVGLRSIFSAQPPPREEQRWLLPTRSAGARQKFATKPERSEKVTWKDGCVGGERVALRVGPRNFSKKHVCVVQ